MKAVCITFLFTQVVAGCATASKPKEEAKKPERSDLTEVFPPGNPAGESDAVPTPRKSKGN